MKVLAIETSCDETSAAVVTNSDQASNRILSNVIHSQINLHKKYGGVIPEYAARNHLDNINNVVIEALSLANIDLNAIDIIAATTGPGLIGGLLVGSIFAKTLALLANKPFMAINHLEGHLLTARMCFETLHFPYILMLASGGHFIFAEIHGIGNYKILGETIDDAAGEAFDKVAKMLDMPYPGGPSIENAARDGDKTRFPYTIPLQKREGCDVSFSGLKTATKAHISSIKSISTQDKMDIAASFQYTAVKFIVKQLKKAIALSSFHVQDIVLAGGVAANTELRSAISDFCQKNNMRIFAPPISLCSDNAAMIAWAAIERFSAGFGYSDLNAKTMPRWPITQI